ESESHCGHTAATVLASVCVCVLMNGYDEHTERVQNDDVPKCLVREIVELGSIPPDLGPMAHGESSREQEGTNRQNRKPSSVNKSRLRVTPGETAISVIGSA